ncbi:hypothetical protein [Humidesulfovibrio sp.]|uniref:hypothetical protein n=1 Tax=Humidesulfovibrio sp. TaxID=2910988 RepID=UPI00280B972A|nr:hypothetical protein [Humidesulfovibrio sp.]
MTRKEPGLLRTSFRFVKQALNENALLRTSVLATVLVVTLTCIGLAFFGVTYSLDPKKPAEAYSPRLFGILFLPAEFLVYDLILGAPAPRTSLKDLYLDWRLPRFFWATLKAMLAVLVPTFAAGLLLVAMTVGFQKGGKPAMAALIVLVLGLIVLLCAAFYYLSRFFYLPINVARREEMPVRAAFRETKGRMWRIGCALFLPYLAILAVTIPVEMLGPVLERNLGFVGLAPWFLLDAGLSGFMSCLGAAVLAFSYQRIIVRGATPAPEPAAVQVPRPQDG